MHGDGRSLRRLKEEARWLGEGWVGNVACKEGLGRSKVLGREPETLVFPLAAPSCCGLGGPPSLVGCWAHEMIGESQAPSMHSCFALFKTCAAATRLPLPSACGLGMEPDVLLATGMCFLSLGASVVPESREEPCPQLPDDPAPPPQV